MDQAKVTEILDRYATKYFGMKGYYLCDFRALNETERFKLIDELNEIESTDGDIVDAIKGIVSALVFMVNDAEDRIEKVRRFIGPMRMNNRLADKEVE